MTTIICNKTEMIADRQYVCFGTIHESTKIYKNTLGLLGLAGNTVHFSKIVKWFNDGMDFENLPDVCGGKADWTALYLSSAGDIYTFDSANFFLDKMEDTFFAIGSGADYATGALDFGANITEAFAIAARRDPATGGRFDLFTLELNA